MSGTRARLWAVRLLVSGKEPTETPVTGFEVRASRYARCDTAEIALAVDRTVTGSGVTPWFAVADTARRDVVLQMRRRDQGGSGWLTVFEGLADGISWHPESGEAVLTCRDYLSLLLDLRLQSDWLNHTAPELISAMAAAAGLETSIDFGAGSAMVGQFWQVEHKRVAVLAQHRFQTAFDLAFFVARETNCDLYAQGRVLTASPVQAPGDAGAVVHDLSGSVTTRALRRDMTAGAGVVVHVASWDSRQRSRSEVYYDGEMFATKPSGVGLVHSFRVPGRRLEDLQRIARGKYARIAAHRLDVHVKLPGRPEVRPRHFARGVSSGTNAWPGELLVDEVVSRASLREGFVQELVLRDRMAGVSA